MDPMTAALLAGGTNILSGFLGRKAAKKQQQQHFVQMRDAATRAGFNPLTVLKATQGGNYGQYGQILSRSIIGDGISAATRAYMNTAERKATYAHERDLEELRTVNRIRINRANQDHIAKLTRQAMQQEYKAGDMVVLTGKDGKPILDKDGQVTYVHKSASEALPTYVAVYNQFTRELYWMPNPELSDIGPMEMLTFYATQPAFAANTASGQGAEMTIPLSKFLPGFGDINVGQPANPRGIRMDLQGIRRADWNLFYPSGALVPPYLKRQGDLRMPAVGQ
jgi:hypothetical protein